MANKTTKTTVKKEPVKVEKTEEVKIEPAKVEKKMPAGDYIFMRTYCGKRGVYYTGVRYTLTADEAEVFKKDIKKC